MRINPFSETDTDDTDLIRRIQGEGSQEAFDLLIRRHQPWIFNLVLRMVTTRPISWRRCACCSLGPT